MFIIHFVIFRYPDGCGCTLSYDTDTPLTMLRLLPEGIGWTRRNRKTDTRIQLSPRKVKLCAQELWILRGIGVRQHYGPSMNYG